MWYWEQNFHQIPRIFDKFSDNVKQLEAKELSLLLGRWVLSLKTEKINTGKINNKN